MFELSSSSFSSSTLVGGWVAAAAALQVDDGRRFDETMRWCWHVVSPLLRMQVPIVQMSGDGVVALATVLDGSIFNMQIVIIIEVGARKDDDDDALFTIEV